MAVFWRSPEQPTDGRNALMHHAYKRWRPLQICLQGKAEPNKDKRGKNLICKYFCQGTQQLRDELLVEINEIS
ncbi:unnamed protein product [Caenorhabditis auriculariae]|uniref:Uncharacterized protein n=1 Tax=Caenorhabditis auriculariae TaxID=2777116 RepID=A0A8S1GW81_9PELO|nr:unnamed protein product [Caenorhabditis auriculariae]